MKERRIHNSQFWRFKIQDWVAPLIHPLQQVMDGLKSGQELVEGQMLT
jgi:hypothetical protein